MLFRSSIKELSDEGARIKIPKGQIIPKSIYLIVNGKDQAFEAEIIWAGTQDLGLKFVRHFTSADLKEPDLKFLRRLLIDRMPRSGDDLLGKERRRSGPAAAHYARGL